MVRSALCAATALLCLALGGCETAQSSPQTSPPPATPWTTYHDGRRGYAVRLPEGWQRAESPVSPLSDPREVLAAGTSPFRHRPTNCGAFAGSARQDLGPADALVTVQERGYDRASAWSEFPARPVSFDAEAAEPPEPACGDSPGTKTWWLPFTDAGRHFYALVVIGPDAPPRVHDQTFGLLNSLRFDPAVQPDWGSSG